MCNDKIQSEKQNNNGDNVMLWVDMLAKKRISGVINVDFILSLLMAKRLPRAKHGAKRKIALSSDDANNTPFSVVIGSTITSTQVNEEITLFRMSPTINTKSNTMYAATS